MRVIVERVCGTRVKYVHDKCRCFKCRCANTDYETARADRRREREPWRTLHVNKTALWYVMHHKTREVVLRTPDRMQARDLRDRLNAEAARTSEQAPVSRIGEERKGGGSE